MNPFDNPIEVKSLIYDCIKDIKLMDAKNISNIIYTYCIEIDPLIYRINTYDMCKNKYEFDALEPYVYFGQFLFYDKNPLDHDLIYKTELLSVLHRSNFKSDSYIIDSWGKSNTTQKIKFYYSNNNLYLITKDSLLKQVYPEYFNIHEPPKLSIYQFFCMKDLFNDIFWYKLPTDFLSYTIYGTKEVNTHDDVLIGQIKIPLILNYNNVILVIRIDFKTSIKFKNGEKVIPHCKPKNLLQPLFEHTDINKNEVLENVSVMFDNVKYIPLLFNSFSKDRYNFYINFSTYKSFYRTP